MRWTCPAVVFPSDFALGFSGRTEEVIWLAAWAGTVNSPDCREVELLLVELLWGDESARSPVFGLSDSCIVHFCIICEISKNLCSRPSPLLRSNAFWLLEGSGSLFFITRSVIVACVKECYEESEVTLHVSRKGQLRFRAQQVISRRTQCATTATLCFHCQRFWHVSLTRASYFETAFVLNSPV